LPSGSSLAYTPAMTTDPQHLVNLGMAALERGDPASAAPLLREAAAALPAAQMPWLALANVEMALGQFEAAEAAIARQLELDIRDIGALFMRGLLNERRGDQRAATQCYQAMVNQAAAFGAPPELAEPLAHARRFVAEAQADYAAHLEATIGGNLSPLMRQAVDLLTGRTQLYLQQPSVFYFPGLPQRWFYEPADFPWLAGMLDALPAMQEELRAAVGEDGAGRQGFAPYVETVPGRPAANNPLRDDPAWGACYFWRDGAPVGEMAAACPATMAALDLAPMPRIPGRAPTALWSRLLPGAHIVPHHGLLNTRLICHIPIRTAPGCTLRVGGETRSWEAGVPLVFDDSIEHEARNQGNQARVVLLFEIWRPEIHAEDREAICRLFQAIDAFGL
jgi:tetratricopeptide (TPR) repeat protein